MPAAFNSPHRGDRVVDGLPVVVIGAGPVGLAAAAHLLERGLTPLVLEAGIAVGASVARWGQVRTFSPWRYNLDAAAVRVLSDAGWEAPAGDDLPTGSELVEGYLKPLASSERLSPHVRLSSRVTAVSRAGLDKVRSVGRHGRPFVVRVDRTDGVQTDFLAAAVIDASGTYEQPNPLGANGLPALGETNAEAWMSQPLPDILGTDRERFAGRRVAVVGAGHSAATSLLALAHLAGEDHRTRVEWIIRRPEARPFPHGEADELPARRQLGALLHDLVERGAITVHKSFEIRGLTPVGTDQLTAIEIVGAGEGEDPRSLVVDVIVPATGFRPDHSLAAELRLALDPALESPAALAELIDPNEHSCGTVPAHGHAHLAHPDTGYYIVGAKSYGRAPTFLMATGYEQVRSVVAAIAGDAISADNGRSDLQGILCAPAPGETPFGGEINRTVPSAVCGPGNKNLCG